MRGAPKEVFKNVFIILQDHDVRVRLRLDLEKCGYSVYSAASKCDAEELLSSGHIPDFIILDFDSASLRHREFLLAIRSSTAFGKVPILQVSTSQLKAPEGAIPGNELKLDAGSVVSTIVNWCRT